MTLFVMHFCIGAPHILGFFEALQRNTMVSGFHHHRISRTAS